MRARVAASEVYEVYEVYEVWKKPHDIGQSGTGDKNGS